MTGSYSFGDGPEQVERALRDRMAAWGVPGASITVFEGGEILWAQGIGVRQMGRDEPVTPETLFQAGSIGKAVTAVAVLRLVQEGILDLDADVNRYLRSWKVPANGSWQPRITLRQLLSLSAGTTVHGFIGYRLDETVPDLRQILDGASPAKNLPVRVDVLPGTHFRYSGGGTMIVQAILSDVTGQDFPRLARELVFDPLGMTSSTFEQPLPPSLEARAASGHWFGSDVACGRYYVHPEAAAAGLWSTPSDLARLAISVQAAWSGSATGFLGSAVAREMLRPQVAAHIGLGFFLTGEGRGRRFGHSGDTFGFNAELTCFLEAGQGAAIMTNSISSANVVAQALRVLADARGWPALGKKREPAGTGEEGRLGAAVGRYELDSGTRIVFQAVRGLPVLRVVGQDPVALRAASRDGFVADDLDLTVRLLQDQGDVVRGLLLDQGGEVQEARRLQAVFT